MPRSFSESELEAYLDESLDPTRAAELETRLKSDRDLIEKLAYINGRRDAGIHTLGEIWRKHQLGVPSRETLEQYLSGQLSRGWVEYVRFRVEVLKCRYTIAHLDDLQSALKSEARADTESRRQRLYAKGEEMLKKKRRGKA